MATTLIRNGDVLALAPDRVTAARRDVLVRDGLIVAVAPALDAPPDAEIVEAAGHLVMPGLVNAHFHSPVNHMKGALPGLPLEIFMLYESPALPELAPTPREAYVRTLLAAMEMLKCGTTAVQDDAFFMPFPTDDVVDAVMQAYTDVGIRATVALDQPTLPEIDKLPFLGDIVPAELRDELARPAAMSETELLGIYGRFIARWNGTAGGRIRTAVSNSAPQRVSPEYFAALDDLSRIHGLPFYAHMLETKLQRVLGHTRFGGRSLVRVTADLGLLSARMNLIHGIWIDDADLELIVEAGTVVAHNPISNLRLGSGVMRFRDLYDRGVPLCLGSDEAIADDAVNMWAVAKAAGLVHTLAEDDWERWPQAHEVLRCLIEGGARAMGAAGRLGAVESGREADLILLDLDTLAFTPMNDLGRQLVYCENGSSVRMTMVAGRIVHRDGQVAGFDERAIRAEARALFDARRPALAAARAAADRWMPHYREMALRAMRMDVGIERRVGSRINDDACGLGTLR